MSFDRETRNRLARVVAQARERLRSDAMDQLRRLGFQDDGTVLPLARIEGLTERERAAAQALRDLLDHLAAMERGTDAARQRAAYDRLAREIGFTTLNRLVALRMAEERGLIVQAVGKGLASLGFQVFERIANGAIGGRAETYRAFLESLYDEVALDLPLLFDRSDPRSAIFPGERALEEVLSLLNQPEIAPLWKEDEAIGWVYQYYNDPEERRKMRESRAPRNSRELAVRNQFFTPRYVVEFLTDNTLGRTWYEMRKGETRLVEACRYLVRRKRPIWLGLGEAPPEPFDPAAQRGDAESCGIWTRPNPDLVDPRDLWAYARTAAGACLGAVADAARAVWERFRETGRWEGTFEELRCCLALEEQRYRQLGREPQGDELDALLKLNRALCERWDLEVEVIRHRPKKDPRELRILDPACGSGHFLLYAFDLLLTIYDEAYDDPDLGPALQQAYPERAAFERSVPALILHNNLHGIDIDPRACQIAALALWLRAQRRWQELGLKPAERPQIRKTQIVCAEAMPGERDLLEEYLIAVDKRLRPLVRTIWQRMQIASEAGSLLKIEEEIKDEVRKARIAALVEAPPAQLRLDGGQPPQQMAMAMAAVDEIAFWDQAEAKLLEALQDYATRTENGRATQRRLFAEDAAQGFAFIDACRKVFDVVLMNPPFGEAAAGAASYLNGAYPRTKNDLFAAFVERWLHRLCRAGQLGAITSRTGFFLTSFRRWREEVLLQEARPIAVADLGYGVLDTAMVETAAYCLERA